MRPQLHLDKKKDGALIRKIEGLAGEKRPRKKRGAPTLGLLGKQILELTPGNRLEVQRLVARLLAEQDK